MSPEAELLALRREHSLLRLELLAAIEQCRSVTEAVLNIVADTNDLRTAEALAAYFNTGSGDLRFRPVAGHA